MHPSTPSEEELRRLDSTMWQYLCRSLENGTMPPEHVIDCCTALTAHAIAVSSRSSGVAHGKVQYVFADLLQRVSLYRWSEPEAVPSKAQDPS